MDDQALAQGATIISGGQTGVDRAALDFAIANGLAYGGWCPRGGWAEDQPEPPGVMTRYPLLRQTPSADPAQRTQWNVRDSDAVLILSRGEEAHSPGTSLASKLAERLERPFFHARVEDVEAAGAVSVWVKSLPAGARLSVGGPRESEAPGIYAEALAFLECIGAAFAPRPFAR